VADFHPPGCEHSLCSFSAVYRRPPAGGLTLVPRSGGCCEASAASEPILAEEGARRSRAFTARHWRGVPDESSRTAPADDFDRFLAAAGAGERFTLSGMAFMDAWTLDLERPGLLHPRGGPDARLIPFCLYNLTAVDGRTLYRPASLAPGDAGR
jgi:hypothetical protein